MLVVDRLLLSRYEDLYNRISGVYMLLLFLHYFRVELKLVWVFDE